MRSVFALLLLALSAGCAAAQAPPSYVVFFQEWSSALDDSGNGVIAHAAAWAKAHPAATVQVTGFADPTGSHRANILISELRAQVVVDQLTADGIDPSRISQVGEGSVQPALSTQESRRVQVSFHAR
jgi:outer membrane protein OmpA-like peptidoglycan-associated protein